MSSVGGIGGGSAPQQSSSKSTIGGRGVGASFDNNSATIVNTLGQINRAFSNSFVKLNTAVSSIQISKSALEDLLKITNKLISLAEKSSERSLNNGDRQRLDTDFQKFIRQFRKILRDTKEDGVNLLDKNELNNALKDAGIELEQSAELADTLKKIAGLDNILGIERVRSPEVVVDEIVRKRKIVSYVNEREITIGDGSFNANASYSIGITPEFLISADINGNSIQDLLVSGSAPDTLQILNGNGDGTFSLGNSFTLGSVPNKLIYKDITGDGTKDILSLDSIAGTISVLAGNSDGSFASRISYEANGPLSELIAEDFDGDGIIDLATLNTSDNTVSILTGNLDGSFSSAISFAAPINPSSISAVDLNGNGNLDLVVSSESGNSVTTFFNNGLGSFTPGVSYAVGDTPSKVETRDLNKDGFADIITVNEADNSISILLNNGDGTFSAAISYQIEAGGQSIQVLDYNQNGNIDLIIGSGSGGSPGAVQLLRGNGDGSFEAAISFDTGTSATAIAIADFNGDGALDFAVSDTESNAVRILIANATTTGELDFVGTGTFEKVSPGGAGSSTLEQDGTFVSETSPGEVSIDGSFKNSASPNDVNSNPTRVELVDLNGNGIKDLITLGDNELSIQLGNGDGSFMAPIRTVGIQGIQDFTFFDAEGDGKIDLLSIYQFTTEPDGTFVNGGATYLTSEAPARVELIDVDADDVLDLVSINPAADGTGSTMSIQIGNGDGSFKAGTSYSVLVNPNDIQLFDADGNGSIDALISGVTGQETVSSGTYIHSGAATYSTANNPTGIRLEDVDGDSILDIVTIDPGQDGTGNYLSVQKGNGDGTFLAATSSRLDTFGLHSPNDFESADINGDSEIDILSGHSGTIIGTPSVDLTVSSYQTGANNRTLLSLDLNGDGDLDLVAADSFGSSIQIQLGNGDGSFSSAISYVGANSMRSFEIQDLDGDDFKDIIFNTSTRIYVMKGNADGSFNTAISYAANFPFAANVDFSIGDINEDGNLDIVTTGRESNNIGVLLGNSDGSFNSRIIYSAGTTTSSSYVELADLDRDGNLDALIYDQGEGRVRFLKGNGDGSFNATSASHIASFGISAWNEPIYKNFELADINGDGLLDLIGSLDNLDSSMSVSLGNGDGTFKAQQFYQTNAYARNFELADVNGDGKTDIIANDNDGVNDKGIISILIGNGDGSFQAYQSYTVSTSQVLNLSDIAVGDFNTDGTLDFAVINNGTSTIEILTSNNDAPTQQVAYINALTGNGDGNFSVGTSYYVGEEMNRFTLSDIGSTPDGNKDVIAAGGSTNSIYTLLGNANGSYQSAISYAGTGFIYDVLSADVNGNGTQDIIASDSENGKILFYQGNADGSFSAAISYDAGAGASTLANVDLDGDGNIDIVASNAENNTVSVLFGNGNGSFKARISYQVGANISDIKVIEANGKGYSDLILSSSDSNSAFLLLNNGDGTLKAPSSFLVGGNSYGLAVGDINGDTINDFVVSNFTQGEVKTFISETELKDILALQLLSGNGDGTFSTSSTYAASDNITSFTSGSLTQDGYNDIITADGDNGTVSIYLANGDGSYAARTSINIGGSISDVFTNDVDGDGNLDIIAVDSENGEAKIIFGNTSIGNASYALGTSPTKLTMADVSGDGFLDIVALDSATNKVLVSFANSDGSFQSARSYAAPTDATDIRIANMDQSNGLDILITSSTGESVSVLYNNGDGRFKSGVSYNVQGSATGLAIGDTNDDGVLDIAVSNEDLSGVKILLGNAPDRYIVSYEGRGDGTFQTIDLFDAAKTAKDLSSGDFNNDGNIDAVTADGSAGTISVFTANSDGSFSTRVSYALGGIINDVEVFDFNSDGNLDIAALDKNSGELKVLFGNGDGSFGSEPLINSTQLGTRPEKFTIADLNGDGLADVAAIDTSSNSLFVSFGNADGSFNNAASYGAPTGATDIRIADLDSNGSKDIVISSGSENSVAVFFNNGDGSFQASISYNIQGSAGGLAVGDLNGDGLSDIAVSNTSEADVRILLGNSSVINGGFQTDERPIAAILEDVNGNGSLDAIVASTGGINGDASINILSGNGDGSFQSYVSYYAGSDISSFKMADLDDPADGYKDIVIAGGTSGTVNILQANADGSFNAMLSFFASGDVRDVQIGDFDNDGTLDVIATVVTSYEEIYDLTGDGTNSADDAQMILDYIGTFGSGPSGGSPLDVNGDGQINPTDALIVNNHLSAPPKGKVLFFQGNGDGSFTQSTSFIAGSGADKVSMLDLNNDGELDLVITNQGQNSISVLTGNGDGSFNSRVSYSVYGSPVSLSQQDLNADGFIDLVVGSINEAGDDVVNILYSNNDGSFQAAISITVDKGIKDAIAYDFNDDGNQDLIVTSSLTNATKIYFGNGDGSFTSPTSYEGGRGSSGLTLGDINNDGLLDFITTSSADNDIQVHLAQGDLLVSAGGGYKLQEGAYQLASGDLDGDGNTDILSVNRGTIGDGNTISILLGNGDSSFKAQVSYSSATAPSAAVIGDFNGNGFNDIILGADGDDVLQLLVNNGDGTFASAVTIASISGGVSQIISKDFNADGILDIALTGAATGEINILLSNGDGSFSEPIILAGGADLRTLSAGDINGDGRMDIVAGSAGDGEIRVYSGNGDGYFAAGETIGQGGDPRGINLADINRNGVLDIVYADELDGSIAIRYGNGDGTFKSAVRYDAGTSPRDLKLEDLNGDGIQDILTIDETNNQLKVLTGNLDGSFKAAISYATAQGPISLSLGDFNNDGVTDVATLSSENSTVDIFNGIVNTRGVGDGTFGGGISFDGAPGSSFQDSQLFDINGDGILDAITADGSGDSFSVFQGNGDGSFQAQVSYNVGFSVDRIQVSDVNFDGSRDIIISSSEADSLFIALGNTNGTFNAVSSYQAGQTPSDFTYLDMNQDGVKDLVSISSGDNSLNILLGNADGSFSEMQSLGLASSPGTISKGDVNGDGFEDIAIASTDGAGVSVFLNNGNGSLSAPISLHVGKAVNDAAIGDFNGDGILDVLAVSNNELNLFLGCGDGSFAPRTSFKTNSANERIEVKDLNGNGFLDLVSISESQSNVSVFLNNGDGSFNLASSLDNINGATSISIGDLNNDGSVDIISTTSSPDSKLKAFIASTVNKTVTEMEDTRVTEKKSVNFIERPRTTSPLDRDVVSRGQAMIAMDSLKKLQNIIKRDLKGIDKVLEELTRANKLSEEALIAIEGINPNGITSLSQLSQRLQSRIKASSKDLLIGANDVNRDLIDSLLK